MAVLGAGGVTVVGLVVVVAAAVMEVVEMAMTAVAMAEEAMAMVVMEAAAKVVEAGLRGGGDTECTGCGNSTERAHYSGHCSLSSCRQASGTGGGGRWLPAQAVEIGLALVAARMRSGRLRTAIAA